MSTTQNPTKTTEANRCDTKVTLTRADDLRLGDTFAAPSWRGGWELTKVWSLSLEGDDVEVNGGQLTTSQGNTLQVLSVR